MAILAALLGLASGIRSSAADLKEAQQQLLSGNYTGTVALAEQALSDGQDAEEWQLLRSQALLATGRYPEARKAITPVLGHERGSIRLLWQAREVLLCNGQTGAAREMLRGIARWFESAPRSYGDAASLVVYGQAKLLLGSDPKSVLDQVFEAAKKADPKLREVYLASGNLALEKHDFALAAKRFQEGLKLLPDDPDLHCGLAQAYAPSDTALMSAALEAALTRNSNHVGSLLLLTDHNIDAEDYAQAANLLDRIQAVNPWHPEAWAYRAVLANLQGQTEAEHNARETALKFWPQNPRVEYLIGRKLSQNYRFTEGEQHQRAALEFDPDYLPAKAQLAEDLLRLGQETEGWKLVEEVQKQDGYDTEAYNLATLHDTMTKYATLTNRDFLVRMTRHEAAVYGQRVLALLGRARTNLCAKYGTDLKRPTIVEVFAEQKDFAVRTFGMPGNPGYLGVCFGQVVTANSPATQAGHPVNWEAVLWHEFCHVVTLQITHNKMPRWLSEGISVYEELQANPTWGQRMNPDYREMVMSDELTPVSKLSAAFLSPPTEQHLQFAYYESALVVEFLVQRFGLEQLKAILRDLGQGAEINAAIEKHTTPMAKLEKEFDAFAHERAEQLAPGLDWEKPEFASLVETVRPQRRSRPDRRPRQGSTSTTNAVPPVAIDTTVATNLTVASNAPPIRLAVEPPSPETWEAWSKERPTNFWALVSQAQQFIEDKHWAEAKPVLQKLVELYPDFTGSDSAYRLLAAAHRALGETNAERQVLARFAQQDDKAPDAYQRLMELAAEAHDWPAVIENAQRYLAVNPLVAPPYRFLAQASEQTSQSPTAIAAYRALLELDPPDPAEVHFHLAKALHQVGDPEAKRQVLQALEEAPRYREALSLLLEIEDHKPNGT